jgi:hypothetical protein
MFKYKLHNIDTKSNIINGFDIHDAGFKSNTRFDIKFSKLFYL